MKIPLDLLEPSDLVVKLPISAYLSATAPAPVTLRSRLGAAKMLPLGWTVAEEGTQPEPGICPPLVIYKHLVVRVLAAPCVLFTLSIEDQFTWKLRLGTSAKTGGFASTLQVARYLPKSWMKSCVYVQCFFI